MARSTQDSPMSAAPPATRENAWLQWFGLACGLVLGLSLIKFGNPVLLEHLIAAPEGLLEWIVQPWPVAWGYAMLAALVISGLALARAERALPRLWLAFPLVWLAWQLVSSLTTVAPGLSRPTVIHFISCVLWLGVGLFALSRVRNLVSFWICLALAFWWILWLGFDQHYGGLEATRKFIYDQPNWQQYPPEYLQRIASRRIFSTLFYPNALAGLILLLTPVLLMATWQITTRMRASIRLLFVGLLAYCSLAALYWSGSKAGWLIGLGLAALALMYQRIEQRYKVAVLAMLCAGGLAGFFIRYAGYFERGATSVAARFDYWRAALTTAAANPILGTGPGTFQIAYREIKPPEAEMARLVHNDYLQQFSDSGVIGGLAYLGFVLAGLWFAYPRAASDRALRLALWIGLLAWSCHGWVEFPLYIPALAWPWFLFLGYLAGVNGRETGRQPLAEPLSSRPDR
jgi:hypothetical protein